MSSSDRLPGSIGSGSCLLSPRSCLFLCACLRLRRASDGWCRASGLVVPARVCNAADLVRGEIIDSHQGTQLLVIAAQACRLVLTDYFRDCRFLDLVTEVFRLDQSFLSRLSQSLFEWCQVLRQRQGFLQQSDGITRLDRGIGLLAQALAHL